jgi:hypothetical protein
MGRISDFFGYLECPTDKFSNSWVNFNLHSLSITLEMAKMRREFIQQVKNQSKSSDKMPELSPRTQKSKSEKEKLLDERSADLKKFENGEMTKEEFLNKWV